MSNLLRRHRSGGDSYLVWRETSIAGVPILVHMDIADECDAEVAAADDTTISLDYTLRESPQYWRGDSCGAVLKLAEYVIGNLRAGR